MKKLWRVLARRESLAGPVHRAAGRLYGYAFDLLRGLHPEWDPRRWSNQELRRLGHLFEGEIINVSGHKDEDKEGSVYADYFPRRAGYAVSNVATERGLTGRPGEIYLDLNQELPAGLAGRFDLAFNHTVLEHVFDLGQAVANLCGLSRDAVVAVTPFLQPVHWDEGYEDHWRPTPFALARLFAAQGFEVVYWSANDNPVFNVYLFTLATRLPEKWRPLLPPLRSLTRENAPGRAWFEGRAPEKI
jgi:hypothetical protein